MLRAVAFVLLSLTAAGLAASDAAGRALAKRLPHVAAQLPFASGFAKSGAANVLLAKGLGGGLFETIDLPPADQRRVAALSRAGYRAEPLNHEAVRNLALLAASGGQADRATRLMRIAEGLSKRDVGANIWLAGDYARRGEVAASLAMYDQGLRTSAQARELIIPAMIRQLGNPALVDPVVQLLAQNPPWLGHFWAAAPRYVDVHANLGRIRLALANRGVKVDADHDRALVEALAATGNVGVAAELVRRLAPRRGARGDVVRNAGFDDPPDYLPFDFETMFDASLTADLDDRAGVLRVSVFGEGSGPAARQLVVLPAQRYRLVVRARDWNADQQGLLYFKLACAERGRSGETAPVVLRAASLSATLAKPVAGCVHHWLTIYAAPSPGGRTATAALDRVSLLPLS